MVASAVICWLAYVGPGIWPLAFVSWAPFVLALRGRTPKQAFWIGLFGGTSMIAGGFYWLLGMLKTFSGFPMALCALFALLLWTYQGGRYALTSWLAVRAAARGFSFAGAFVAAYATTELLYPLLFPYYWAAAMKDVPVMTQIADIGGPILVTAVVMGVNVAIAEAVLIFFGSGDKRVMIAAGGALAFTFVYGLVRIAMVESQMKKSEAVEVGIVQGNLGLMQQHTDAFESLRRHRKATADLKKAGAKLVVWSESSVDFAADDTEISPYYKGMVTRGIGVPLIFGTVIVHYPDTPKGRKKLYNTALSTNAEGDVTGRYDKEFLLAFGEYLPLGETFPVFYEWSPNSGGFTPGTKLDALPFESENGSKHTIAVLICYEDIIPSFVNDLAKNTDPDLLVNITNDAWFGVTYEPWQHLALAQMRTIEHRRYLVRATNSGVSAIIDPLGRVVAQTGVRDVQSHIKDADTAHAPVRFLRAFTLYSVLGDFVWYFVALGAIFAAFKRKKPQ